MAQVLPEKMPTKDAATVMLLRDGPAGVEVFLQRRVIGMAFAGGATVFPGGGVDPSDSDPGIGWAGPSRQWWAERLRTTTDVAAALVLAAVRETFEECGVLLAGRGGALVGDTAKYRQHRRDLESRRLSFGQFLKDEDLVVRTDLLRPWAHWITPIGEPRRYDTRFFVAALPEGQVTDDSTSETDLVFWRTPSAAISDWRGEQSMLMPPTWSQLDSLSRFSSVEDVLAAEPDITAILPELVVDEHGTDLVFPGQEAFYAAGGPIPWRTAPAE